MANKNANEVAVVREYTSRVGGFEISRSAEGINLVTGENTLVIPNGATGRAILNEALGFVTDEAPAKGKGKAKNATGVKRTRRTKAQMEAARAAEAAGKAGDIGSTPESEDELETV